MTTEKKKVLFVFTQSSELKESVLGNLNHYFSFQPLNSPNLNSPNLNSSNRNINKVNLPNDHPLHELQFKYDFDFVIFTEKQNILKNLSTYVAIIFDLENNKKLQESITKDTCSKLKFVKVEFWLQRFITLTFA
eukprot:TRINITY_DN169_c2_g1_i1.p1 TRINITY_DN169_c2_g1~~TRINITY_DN169_c2_g1_i1.p1  ORF type:complete len:134 (+),score=38.97 TRINITY_DN169_c2_g1_i1:53-454(+)